MIILDYINDTAYRSISNNIDHMHEVDYSYYAIITAAADLILRATALH